jgi:hypothetical protein
MNMLPRGTGRVVEHLAAVGVVGEIALGEGPVQHPLRTVASADPPGLGDRAQRRPAGQGALLEQLHRELTGALHRVAALLLSDHPVDILGQQQHELHRSALRHSRVLIGDVG